MSQVGEIGMILREAALRGVKPTTILRRLPPTVSVPLREDPPGVLLLGNSRVLLELVIHAQ